MRGGAVVAGLGVAVLFLGLGRKKDSMAMVTVLPELSGTVPQKVAELALWDAQRWQGMNEQSPGARERIEEYWAAARVPFKDVETAWSAAWISWVVNSVAPGALPRSGSHVNYSHLAMGGMGKFRAIDPATLGGVYQVGDILVFNRGGSKHTFESLKTEKFGISHGDVVVNVSGDSVSLVGGNKGADGSVLVVRAQASKLAPFVVLRYAGDQKNA